VYDTYNERDLEGYLIVNITTNETAMVRASNPEGGADGRERVATGCQASSDLVLARLSG